MAHRGLLVLLSLCLTLCLASAQEKGQPHYVGTAVFNKPPPMYHGVTSYPLQSDALAEKVNEVFGVMRKYLVQAIDMVKHRLQSGEPLVLVGVVGIVFLYTYELLKSVLVKISSTFGLSKPYKKLYNPNNSLLDDATSRVWRAVSEGECLQKAACQLGKHTNQYYNNANDLFRFLRVMPSQGVVEAFLKSADGYDDCSTYDCE